MTKLRPLVALAAILSLAGCSGAAAPHPGTPKTIAPAVPASPPASPGPSPSPSPTPTGALPIAGADGTGTIPTEAAVAAAVATPLSDAGLGPAKDVHALVIDAATGQTLLDTGGGDASPPASTIKLATAAAALTVLGPRTRLVTTVAGATPVNGTVTGDLVLIGAGDPTLTTATSALAGRVSMAAIAKTLVAAGVKRVTGSVIGDGSLFTGAGTAPGWHPSYVTDGSVAPVSALEVDGGRYGPSPEPAPRVADATLTAAVDLTAALRLAHVTVAGEGGVSPTGPTPGDTVLAALPGPPVATLVRQMLTYSDNDLAESLGRLVSLRAGGAGDFAGAAAAVIAADNAAGFDLTGTTLSDTSGLSTDDRIPPAALVAIVRAAVLGGHADLRPLALGMPVAGRTGTLKERYQVAPAKSAVGRVHAKTGALIGVSTEDGWLVDAGGRMLVFAFGSDDTASRPAAEAALDRAAAALVTLS